MSVTSKNGAKALLLVGFGIAIGVAMPGAQPSTAKELKKNDPTRIGYFNVPKTISEFQWAKQEADQLNKIRSGYVDRVNTERQTLANLNEQFKQAGDPQLQSALKEQAIRVQLGIEAIEKESTARITEITNKLLPLIYERFREITSAIAKEQGLDVVEGYPATFKPEDEKSPAIAQLMLQTPALIPFYLNPDLDYTNEIIERLNTKYPPGKKRHPSD